MDTELFLLSAEISGLIGSIAPFLFPFLFKLQEKVLRKELTKSEKRLTVTMISVAVSLIVILSRFQWEGVLENDLRKFIEFFFVNFVSVKAMIQTIYELIIKEVPSLNERFS